jgi:hypothetical protein
MEKGKPGVTCILSTLNTPHYNYILPLLEERVWGEVKKPAYPYSFPTE